MTLNKKCSVCGESIDPIRLNKAPKLKYCSFECAKKGGRVFLELMPAVAGLIVAFLIYSYAQANADQYMEGMPVMAAIFTFLLIWISGRFGVFSGLKNSYKLE